MPLMLLWHPRVPQEVDIPMDLEIIGYTRRWAIEDAQTRWHIPAYARRWLIMWHDRKKRD